MRVLTVLCLALLLAACNRVITDKPLFQPSSDAPKVREGLWVMEAPPGLKDGGKPCRFDARKPATRWPDCASWLLVRQGEWLHYDPDSETKWERMPVVLAGASPSVLQMTDVDEGDGSLSYSYFGVEPTRTGADGRIESYLFWYVVCGPPPPEGTKTPEGKDRYVTLEPFPGLTIRGDNCTTDSPDVLVAAAMASKGMGPGAHARWIRDTWP